METYEKEFKEQAVIMAREVGASKAARDLGIPVNTLYTWISKSKAHGEGAHVGSGNKRESRPRNEAAELTRRIRELERANQILKDALGFFVVSQKR